MRSEVSTREALRYLRDIHDETRCFYTCDGKTLKNLFELYHYIRISDKDSFRHHVNGCDNHFADWVAEVILDSRLSTLLRNCVLKEPMAYRLLWRINHLVSNSQKPPTNHDILAPAVAPEEVFVTSDGKRLRDMWDLLDYVCSADPNHIERHLDCGRNHISEWVGDILLDEQLAESIRDFSDPQDIAFLISRRIKELESNTLCDSDGSKYKIRIIKSIRS